MTIISVTGTINGEISTDPNQTCLPVHFCVFIVHLKSHCLVHCHDNGYRRVVSTQRYTGNYY